MSVPASLRLLSLSRRQLLLQSANKTPFRPALLNASSSQSRRTMAGDPTVSDVPAPSTNNPSSAETTPDTVPNATEGNQPLPLPPPPASGDGVTQLDVSTGQAVKLDHLGPLVVNRDGTLSRIANWENMAEIERQNTLRILGKRNQLRMESLKAQEEQGKGQGQ